MYLSKARRDLAFKQLRSFAHARANVVCVVNEVAAGLLGEGLVFIDGSRHQSWFFSPGPPGAYRNGLAFRNLASSSSRAI